MPPDDDLSALEAQLDPAGRAVLALMRRYLDSLQATIDGLRGDLARRDEQIATLQQMLFGRRSEKTPHVPRIRTEVEALRASEPFAALDPASADVAGDAPTARQRGRAKSEAARRAAKDKRRALPIVEQVVEVAPEQLPTGYTLADFAQLGQGSVVERIEHVREHLQVTRYRLQTLQSRDRKHILTASTPPSVTEGTQYGASVYAHVVVSKCLDTIPQHRLERILERAGCRIARSVLCNMFHRSAELLEPIWRRLVELAAHSPYLNADETPQPVMDQDGCRRGYIWTLLSADVAAYVFSDTRAAETPNHLLAGTKGYLQVDGYSGYAAVCRPEGRTRVGCWAHVRRKFYEARTSVPEADEAIGLVARLYRVEYEAAERDLLGSDAHRLLRQTHSRPLVDDFEKWLAEQAGLHPPKSKMGEAIKYASKQMKHLRRFLDDPSLALDNNASERALRIIALGRKNFLFVGHDEAGHNLAVLQTIVATCRLADVHPADYIADVLIRVQTVPASRLDELLPMNWKPPASPPAP